MTSPFAISRSMPLSTSTGPNDLCISTTRTRGLPELTASKRPVNGVCSTADASDAELFTSLIC
ncbi:hypothetical protein ACFPRL_28370 [Pseudoclavibacter helvolus]